MAHETEAGSRLRVRKTCKLFIGGAFPRSESGQVTAVQGVDGEFIAHVARASRKDARDAVRAARAAQPGWAGASEYLRGQVLYRVAEMIEGRAAQFVEELVLTERLTEREAHAQVAAAVYLWVWYAGWTDKIAAVGGSVNPVTGPFQSVAAPEPTGVVAIIAPQDEGLLGLTSVVAPALVTGNTVVAVPAPRSPFAAVTLAEVFATSDVPAGVVNLLTGDPGELAPWLAGHGDVNAIDLAGAGGLDWAELEAAAAETLQRVLRPVAGLPSASPQRVLALTELKTTWLPVSQR